MATIKLTDLKLLLASAAKGKHRYNINYISVEVFDDFYSLSATDTHLYTTIFCGNIARPDKKVESKKHFLINPGDLKNLVKPSGDRGFKKFSLNRLEALAEKATAASDFPNWRLFWEPELDTDERVIFYPQENRIAFDTCRKFDFDVLKKVQAWSKGFNKALTFYREKKQGRFRVSNNSSQVIIAVS